MNVTMRVHRVSTHHTERTVTHEGEEARAMVAELEVELTDAGDAGHGTTTLHFRSQGKIAAAKDVFTQGGQVTLTFAAAAPKAIETVAEPGGEPA